MTEYIADYAWPPHPSVDALKATGCTGVMRYLSYRPNDKVITRDEYHQLVAAGLTVGFVWEFDARDFVNSSFSASGAARIALDILAEIGAPSDSVIYYAVDFDIQRSQWWTVMNRLLSGPIAVHGRERTGIYGPYDALEWARNDGVASHFWQAGLSTAWSNGRNRSEFPYNDLYQIRQANIGGADCDLNLRGQGGTVDSATEYALKVAFAAAYDGVTGISPSSWMARAVEAPLNAVNAKVDALTELVTALPTVEPIDYPKLVAEMLRQLGDK